MIIEHFNPSRSAIWMIVDGDIGERPGMNHYRLIFSAVTEGRINGIGASRRHRLPHFQISGVKIYLIS